MRKRKSRPRRSTRPPRCRQPQPIPRQPPSAHGNRLGTPGTTNGKITGSNTTTGIQGKGQFDLNLCQCAGNEEAAATAATDANHGSAAPQPVTEAKPDSQVALANAAKGEGNGASAPPQPSHDHAQAPGNAQPAPVITDPNAQLAARAAAAFRRRAYGSSDKFSVTQGPARPVPVSGLAVEIAATAQSGKSHFEVRLDPADLGRIDVRIDVDRNGQIHRI